VYAINLTTGKQAGFTPLEADPVLTQLAYGFVTSAQLMCPVLQCNQWTEKMVGCN
jgi:hypothetical protein